MDQQGTTLSDTSDCKRVEGRIIDPGNWVSTKEANPGNHPESKSIQLQEMQKIGPFDTIKNFTSV